MFKQNKMTYQCLSRKSGATRKSMNVLPEMLKLQYVPGFWALKLPRKSGSSDSEVSKNCSVENWGNFESIISKNSSFKSTLLRGVNPPEFLEETHTGILPLFAFFCWFRSLSVTVGSCFACLRVTAGSCYSFLRVTAAIRLMCLCFYVPPCIESCLKPCLQLQLPDDTKSVVNLVHQQSATCGATIVPTYIDRISSPPSYTQSLKNHLYFCNQILLTFAPAMKKPAVSEMECGYETVDWGKQPDAAASATPAGTHPDTAAPRAKAKAKNRRQPASHQRP